MTSLVETIWSLSWLAGIIALLAALPRLGKLNVASWLAVIGVILLAIEEPLLTFWFGLTTSHAEVDGLSGLVSPQALAHVLVAAIWATAWAAVLVWVARTRLRRREQSAWLMLLFGLVVAAATEVGTSVLVFSRGLPLPTPGGSAGAGGIGWQPVAVGLLAWALALVLSRPETEALSGV